jgi:hypothetical protein
MADKDKLAKYRTEIQQVSAWLSCSCQFLVAILSIICDAVVS